MGLPDPLSSPDCDLRGLQWMPLDVGRIVDSDLFLISSGDEFKAAFRLWCKSWEQVPAGSLPNNDVVLAGLALAKNWKKVREVAMRNWVLCSDNRWYHPVVAAKAMEALPSRQDFVAKKSAAAERKDRERADRKSLFELLRTHGIVPNYDTKTSALRDMVKQYVRPNDTPTNVTSGVTDSVTGHADVTARTGTPQGEGQGSLIPSEAGASGGAPPPALPTVTAQDQVFAIGVALLTAEGVIEKNARSFLAMQCKSHGAAAVVQALQQCAEDKPVQAIPWLQTVLKAQNLGQPGKPDDRKTRQLQTAALMTGATPPQRKPDAHDVESRILPA